MSKISIDELRALKEKGYDIPIKDKVIAKAKRKEELKNRPEPPKPDPLPGLIKQLVAEIKEQASAQSEATDKIVVRVVEALTGGMKELKPEPPKPKTWQFEAFDADGKLKYTIEAKEI